jgi:hypothetical protein
MTAYTAKTILCLGIEWSLFSLWLLADTKDAVLKHEEVLNEALETGCPSDTFHFIGVCDKLEGKCAVADEDD